MAGEHAELRHHGCQVEPRSTKHSGTSPIKIWAPRHVDDPRAMSAFLLGVVVIGVFSLGGQAAGIGRTRASVARHKPVTDRAAVAPSGSDRPSAVLHRVGPSVSHAVFAVPRARLPNWRCRHGQAAALAVQERMCPSGSWLRTINRNQRTLVRSRGRDQSRSPIATALLRCSLEERLIGHAADPHHPLREER